MVLKFKTMLCPDCEEGHLLMKSVVPVYLSRDDIRTPDDIDERAMRKPPFYRIRVDFRCSNCKYDDIKLIDLAELAIAHCVEREQI